MSETVLVTVTALRRRIHEAGGGGSPAGSPAGGALFGRLFHQTAAALLDREHPAHWEQILEDEPEAARLLAARLYDLVLGPALLCNRGVLEGAGEELLGLWSAVQTFAQWFCQLVEAAKQGGALSYDRKLELWQGALEMFQSEVDLSARFREPGWRVPVVVSGRADHLIQAGPGRWCVVEFKLGSDDESASLAQACLYRLLLEAGRPEAPQAAVALVRFLPSGRIHETVISAERVDAVRPQLMALIRAAAEAPESGGIPARPGGGPVRSKPAGAEEEETARRLVAAFAEFGAPVLLTGGPVAGPAFVRYFVEPARGVAAGKVMRQGLNLQTRLRLAHAPLIDIVDGRIAVDVQRADREFVPFRDVRPSLGLFHPRSGSSRALAGVDLAGQPVFADFALPENAHALVAGVAGSGKTEWLRSALASLILSNTPETLRLVLIDPKRNAFPELARSAFLWAPDTFLCPPAHEVIPVLEALVEEMENRFELFEDVRADDLEAFALRSGQRLPRLFCFCDEFADLLLADKRARGVIETTVNRLGQKARAAGIHLVFATQRPSRNVISGILKANMPCRVALRVTDALESRIILDGGGAENLLGRGDLLFSSASGRVRLQSPYLEDADRQSIFGS